MDRLGIAHLGDQAVRLAEQFLGENFSQTLSRIPFHSNALGYDEFGSDPEAMRYALAVTALLHRCYFRTEVHGGENIPATRALLAANHSGQPPLCGVILVATMLLDAEPPRLPRAMVEKWAVAIPFVSLFFARVGQVLGAPENARRLLEREETIIVFPEGIRGISKPFRHRYQLADFGLGFMRLALE